MKQPKKRAPKHDDSYEEKLLKLQSKQARKNRLYSVSCLGAICLFLLGLGITLTSLGSKYEVQDLHILGPIFLVSGVGVAIYILVQMLKHYCKKHKIKPGKTQFEPEYELKLTVEPEVLQRPSSEQLYDQEKFKHITDSGSATVLEVKMPPPPPVYVPNDATKSDVPVTEMTIEEANQCDDYPP